jgi:rhodanese-related sulfurtransferase
MSLPTIAPTEAKRLLEQGAILVDVRERDEHARECIAGARSVPLSRIDHSELALHPGEIAIFHCRSGARTLANGPRLAGRLDQDCQAFILEGGLDAWRRAGLPTLVDRRRPLELQRQVQIAAGSLVVLGTLLGAFVSPWFLAIPGFVGAGLVNAGLTGLCGMARALMHAPWNRPEQAPPAPHTF